MTVSWMFFGLACWGALWTLVSFRPPRRPPALMLVGFFTAWWTTELAPWHLAWQIVATTLLIALGALAGWPGWIGLAITLGSWTALGFGVRRSLHTDRVFHDALQEGLGAPAERDAARLIAWSRVVFPFRFRRRGVARVRNLQYVEGDDARRHRLDVYACDRIAPGAPVLLQIHGGGWMISNKDQQGMPIMYHLAAQGWVCVAVNYGLSPRATWPDHLVDCKRALAWIREHIAEYRGDPDFVVVTGGSAGGHLTAMMGLTANDPQFQPGFETVDTTVRAMIPFYGVYDWTGEGTGNGRDGRDRGLRLLLERWVVKQRFDAARHVYEQASPIFHVREDGPPALVVHGTLDTLAPVTRARAFVERLRATSRQPVVYVELKGAHHAFEVFNSIRTEQTLAGVDRFLAWLLSESSGAAASAPTPCVADQSGNAASPGSAIGRTPTARTEP